MGEIVVVLEYIDRENKLTDDVLLADLTDVSKIVGKKSVTISEYEKYGSYNPSTLMRHFGSWNQALELAGLQISNKQYTLQELYDNLADIWLKLGRQPSRRDLSTLKSPISYKAYERKFGKWSIALKSFIVYYNSGKDLQSYQNTRDDNVTIRSTPRDVNLRMRFLVMQRDNFKCRLCGASPAKDPSVQLHIDHIVPWSKGGENSLDNLQTLCSKCNLGKSDLLVATPCE